MRHFAPWGFLSFACALAGVVPAAAQEAAADADPWMVSGGFDLIELRAGQGDDIFFWDAAFSWGNSRDQVMLVSEGGGALGNQIDETQMRLFYGRTSGNTTWLVGMRKDIKPHPRDIYAAIGVQGMVGTRLSWETYGFLSDDGRLTGEAQLIYALPITQKLYLEPRAAVGWSAQASDRDAVRAGFTEAEATLRLRYRLKPKLNIYTAIVHERLLGGTRALGRSQGEALQSTAAVIGFGFSL